MHILIVNLLAFLVFMFCGVALNIDLFDYNVGIVIMTGVPIISIPVGIIMVCVGDYDFETDEIEYVFEMLEYIGTIGILLSIPILITIFCV